MVDANVLIDYRAADLTVLQLVSRHIGTVHISRQVLQEVHRLDPEECERLGLRVVDESLDQLLEGGQHRGRLTFHDRLCLILARDAGWACVTNDRALRRTCQELSIPVLWGLELMVPLVAGRHLTVAAALTVADAIRESNPRHISEDLLARFAIRLREVEQSVDGPLA